MSEPEMIYKPHRRVSKPAAIEFLAQISKRTSNEELRSAKDRVRKRIEAAVRHGQLKMAVGGNFLVGELIEWARSKPDLREAAFGQPSFVSLSATIRAESRIRAKLVSSFAMPQVLSACQSALREELERNAALQSQLEAQQNELQRLRASAQRREHIRQVNQRNGGIRHPR